jgi:primosomal protein N' (replication factor Y)
VGEADVVAFLDFDGELLAPRFRATEQAMALLVRAARLVGPRRDGGRIIVQTRLPRHDVLDAALHADPGRLVDTERARRRSLGFPPYAAIAAVTGSGTEQFAAALRAVPQLAVLGGAERILVRAEDWATLADGLASVERPIGSRVRVEVDPPRI